MKARGVRILALLAVVMIAMPVWADYDDKNHNGRQDRDEPTISGSSGDSSEPSPEEKEATEASGENAQQSSDVPQVNQRIDAENEAAGTRTAGSQDSITREGNEYKAQTGGDPVLLSSGRYVLAETDSALVGSSFAFGRNYVSEKSTQGSFGAGWSATLDSRIIRGRTPVDATKLTDIKTILDRMAVRAARDWIYSRAQQIGTEIKAKYQSVLSDYNSVKQIADRSAALHGVNASVIFANTPNFYEESGNENLVLIDEGGIPILFVPSGSGEWVPQDVKERLAMKLVSADGNGAETAAGFVLHGKGGVKRHYDGNGLLRKIEEANGKAVTVTRDGKGKATKISGPHGDEWTVSYSGSFISKIAGPEGQTVHYGYSGSQLSSVTDTDGDTVRYTYEDGRLKRIVKADGSYIELTYGYDGAGGAKLVSATTHEEGKSERFEYDSGRKITVYTNHSGVKTTYWYDENHRTTREVHDDGTVAVFAYNADGLLVGELVNGNQTSYQYDARGNVAVKQYADGTRETWTWNTIDRQTQYIDRDGVQTVREYDGAGNCTRVVRGGEVLFSGVYAAGGRLVESQTGNHAREYYTYDARGFIAARRVTVNGQTITEKWTNDALGRVTSYTDGEGRTRTYVYNRKTTVEKTSAGLERTYTYNNRKDLVSIREVDTVSGAAREQTVRYDKRHLAVQVTDGAGEVTAYTYRDDGLMTQRRQGAWTWNYSYDSGGRLNGVTRGMDGSSETYTEQYGYRLQAGGGELRSLLEPGGEATQYEYDSWGRVTGVTNALGERSTRVLSGAGRVIKEQGASGGTFAYSYDRSGRLIGAGREGETTVQVRYNSDGTIAEKTDRNGTRTQYFYDGRGQLIREANAQGSKTYRYDGAGRVIHRETLPSSASGAVTYYTDWEYNDAARTVKVTDGGLYAETWQLNAWEEAVKKTDGAGNTRSWKYNGAGQLAAAVDGYGKETKYTWNAIGKAAKISYADGTLVNYEYNHLGYVTKITDGEGVEWEGGYDSAGRLAWEKGRPGINKEYKYDALGRVTQVSSGGDVVERYRYGARERTVTFTDGAGNGFTLEKNEYAEVTGETNRLGDRQAYSYDKEGRRTAAAAYSGKQIRTVYSGANGTTTTQYTDGTQTVITRDLSGNITSAAGVSGVIRYRYDAGGRLIEQTDEGAGETTAYAYDGAGNRTRMTSGNRDVFYTYGKNNELLRVTDNVQRLSVEFSYNVAGQEVKRTYGNGVMQETFYDKAGRTVLIVEVGATRAILRAEGYVYDALGRRTHSVDELGNITKYQYDNQSRLAAVLYPWTGEKAAGDKKEAEEAGLFFTQDKGAGERYTFSSGELAKVREVLNRVGFNRGNLAGMNQLLWRESYSYDANGNRESKTTPWGTIRYSYDKENRLIRKGAISYTYDKDGNLLTESGARKTVKYEYNGANRMIYSEVTDKVTGHRTITAYDYDAYGRRTVTQDAGMDAMRTLYDGFTFEVIREGVTFRSGGFTTNFTTQRVTPATPNHTQGERYRYITDDNHTQGERYRYITDDNHTQGERYRYITDGNDALGTHTATSESTGTTRYTGINVTLYGRGEAVAMNYTASTGSRGGAAYLGKDILGSVRSTSNEYGLLEDRYEYDAFGKPYKGELSAGMNLGYTGKPYDATTGLYNYGYRDYQPVNAGFTTVDPIRDGVNWVSYVNGDPVNWVDLWGLEIYLKGDKVKTTLGYINKYSAKQYIIDGTGKLLADTTKHNASGSTTYSESIDNLNKKGVAVTIITASAVEMSDGRRLVPHIYGEGVTADPRYTKVDNNYLVALSGKANTSRIYDKEGNLLEKKPAEILIHELVGHANPMVQGKYSANADALENIVRAELKLPLTEERPEHYSANLYQSDVKKGAGCAK